MAIYPSVNDAGTWKTVREIHVKDAGAWKLVKEAWVKDAGTWKRFYGAVIARGTIDPWGYTEFGTSGNNPFGQFALSGSIRTFVAKSPFGYLRVLGRNGNYFDLTDGQTMTRSGSTSSWTFTKTATGQTVTGDTGWYTSLQLYDAPA